MPSSRRTVRRRTSRRFGARRNFIWASVFVTADANLMSGTADGIRILIGADWQRELSVDSIEKGATLVRVVGDVAVRTETTGGTPSLGGSHYIWGLQKNDEEDTTQPSLASDFFGEDWMHIRAGSIPPNNATNIAYAPQPNWRHESIDIRVKRKLTSDDVVTFWFAGVTAVGGTSATETLVFDYMFRSLIQLP